MKCSHLFSLIAILGTGLATAFGAADASLPPEIENHEVLRVGAEPAHATLMPYGSLDQALAGKRRQSSFAQDLNGPWKFHWVGNPSERPFDFWKPEFDDSQWKTIPVPSSWQLQGYDTPIYSNVRYTFRPDWPRVMGEPPRDWPAFKDRNPVGSYRREFVVPSGWTNRRVFVTFDGVDSAFFLWVNGQKVGYSTDSRIPADFDLTKYVKPPGQKNVIAVEVYRYSAGSYLECQDMWRLSGIFRNVTLWSTPQVHIRDFFVKTELDQAYKDATVVVVAKVKNFSDGAGIEQLVMAQLYDPAGKTMKQATATARLGKFDAGQEQEIALSFKVSNPEKWTAETPALYTLVLTTGAGNQPNPQPTELLSTRVGFRKVEIKGSVFMVNGVPVKLKGANRHENWPDTGHYVSEERMARDLDLLKQMNANHVRTCHYPDDPRWYELCDEYGIYLVAEANVECHGLDGAFDNVPSWEAAIVGRNVANVETYKNHPSIVIWSLGNESGGIGANFVKAIKAIKALDSSRVTHYERFGMGPNNPADIDSQMYTSPGQVEQIGKSERKKPFYLCEYAHAMNNSLGSICDYNDLFDRYPNLMGGAIWEWQDQAIWNRRDPSRPFLAYGGDFGDKPNDGVFILKGVVSAERQPNPKFAEAKKAYQWVSFEAEDLAAGRIRVKNRYAFTNLKKFQPTWELLLDGFPAAKGELPPLDLAPGQSATITIPIKNPPIADTGAERLLNVSLRLAANERWEKHGYSVASEQFLLPLLLSGSESVPPSPIPGDVTVNQDDTQIQVTSSADLISVDEKGKASVNALKFQLIFDKKSGTIREWTANGKPLLKPGGGPQLYAYRAPHLNDDLWAAGSWRSRGLNELQFKPTVIEVTNLSLRVTSTASRIYQTGGSHRPGSMVTKANAVQIRVSGESIGKGNFAFSQTTTYTIFGDGAVAMDMSLFPRGAKNFVLPRIGVRLFLDEALTNVIYYGRGPFENYPDRKRGSDLRLLSTTTSALFTPYVATMECGNHEDVRWIEALGVPGFGLLATADGGAMSASALPYSDHELEAVKHPHELPKSSGTVLVLAAKTLGVGSAGCGPRPLPQYVIHAEPLTFSTVLRPIATEKANPALLARAALLPRVKPVLVQRGRDGRVTLETATPGVTLTCAVNGSPAKTYSEPFEFTDNGTVKLMATREGFLPFVGELTLPAGTKRGDWKVVSASSFEPGEGLAEHAIDGDPDTFWHTRYTGSEPRPPHDLVIDLGKPTKLAGIIYTGRQDMDHGRVRDCEVYVSEDGKTWGDPVAKGQFRNTQEPQTLRFPQPTTARYLKFVALSEVARRAWATVAELEILAE